MQNPVFPSKTHQYLQGGQGSAGRCKSRS